MPGPWGKAIERLRLAARKTKKQVAKAADMTATTYGRIERGDHTQTRNIAKIAEALHVPIEEALVSPDRRLSKGDWDRIVGEIYPLVAEKFRREFEELSGHVTQDAIKTIEESVRQAAADFERINSDSKRSKQTAKRKGRVRN